MPAVQPFVIPSWVYNSMALVDRKRGPVVAVTEGMISDFSRSELQGAVAHELSHIIRGDSFYIGLIASLTNFFHELGDKMRPEQTHTPDDREADIGLTLYALLLKLASLTMRLFSSFVSRKRELLADSTAVEMTRNPLALARTIYKAHRGVSSLGNSSGGYSPLFIVSPHSLGMDSKEGILSNLFSTHPPVMNRVMPLLHMARKPVSILRKKEEKHRVRIEPAAPKKGDGTDRSEQGDLWRIRNSKNIWVGPHALSDIVAIPWFTLATPVRLVSGDPGHYPIPREYLERGVRAKYLKQFVDRMTEKGKKRDFAAGSMLCPVCGSDLDSGYYEGVRVRHCRRCEGRLCREETVFRILTRQDVAFSDNFKKMARAWKAKNRINPLIGKRTRSNLWCPSCGMPMTRRNYSMQYFIEVDSCYFCRLVWFDQNELEILQILVEEAKQHRHS
jgi:Zn-finger nucleic acid-binding protein